MAGIDRMAVAPVRFGHLQVPPLALAPMAGVTDAPFRRLCRQLGAGLAVGEMRAARADLRRTRLGQSRALRLEDEPSPYGAQLLGNDPLELAEAARAEVDAGAEWIDLNLGCPAKKVCHKAAGSALLGDERLVGRLLEAVVAAVPVPVTLKFRTGLDPSRRNAVAIARLAEQAGVAALALHGRTRACGYAGVAEHDTLAEVVAAVRIPVWANGDLGDADRALAVLRRTGAAGVMVGRAVLGEPWRFLALRAALDGREPPPTPSLAQQATWMEALLRARHALFGAQEGVMRSRRTLKAWLQVAKKG